MSNRPTSFRFVLGIFVLTLITTSMLISQAPLGEPVVLLNSGDTKEEKKLLDELFPYTARSQTADPASSDLITATTYPFATLTPVALEDMSSGTTQLVGPSLDDTVSPVTSIGFDFWYDGVRHAQFSVNPNGLARLGATVISGSFNNSTDGLGTTVNAPKIAPYFEDLCTGASGKVHYKVVGSSPNRKLVVEWVGMEIPRDGSCGTGPATGVFQLWLFESASATNPGRIQFVYGAGIAASTVDLGASVGLQSGVATNFASVTVTDDSVSYTVANNTNLPGIPAGKSYHFTPNVPASPTALSFAPVTQSSIQINWTDNATNEVGYAIYRSLDGITYSFLTQTAADAVSFNDTGLIPGTTYHYRVAAVSEGALSPAFLSGSQATNPAGSDTCNGAGGNWSDTATWTDASVPTASDNVTIGSGCVVTVDTAAAVALNVTINSGGTLQSPTTGIITTNNLTVGGSVTNNGILDFSTNADTSGAILTFGAPIPNVTFGGTGATTDVRAITVVKGAQSSEVELNPTNFTVLGVNTDSAGFLTLTSGTFKVSGTFTIANRVFTAAAYTIPATGAFWLNNPNFTVAGQNGSPANNGLLRITTGTFNVGIATGNSMGGAAGAQFVFEGGTSNFAGRLQTTSAISYTQSGGTVNVCTVGNTATTACFGLTSTTNTFNMTGGNIVLNFPNTNAAPLDYSVSTSATFVANPAATTLVLGSGLTPAATTFRVLGSPPNILINAGHSMAVGSGAAGGAVFFRGSTVTNNGAIVVQGTGASSRFDWAANGPMSYGGPGTFGTALTPFGGVGMSANGGNTTINSPIFINRINFFTGGFINSNQITMGSGGASGTIIQVGNSTTPTAAGGFDVSPVFNAGTAGHILLHLRTTTLNRVMGFEMPAARNLAQLTFDNNAAGATLALGAGDVTISGAGAGSLAFTNGVMILPPANTLFHNAGTATRTTGYLDGNLSRSFTAIGTYTFHVGQNGYSPLLANVTTLTTNPSSLSVRPTDSTLPGLNAATSVSRQWALAETGDLTSDLTFTYLDADVNGTETDYRIFKLTAGVLTNMCMGGPCVNDVANTATVTGITDFSDWGIGELGSSNPGTLVFSNAAYSINENAGPATITVNRTGGSANTVTVDFASVPGGTATGGASCAAGIDYVNASGTLTFLNGETSKTFNVALCDDMDMESNETVNLSLSNATGGGTIGMPGAAVLTINDNDTAAGPVTVTATAGNPGPTQYNTVKEAFDAINAGTHQGAITVLVNQNTTETASAVLNASGGTAAYTSVLVRPTAMVTVSGTITGAIIRLNGADNVTIDGRIGGTGTSRDLSVINNSAVTATAAIWLSSVGPGAGATNNIVRNVEIACGVNQSTSALNSFGIFMGSGTIAIATNGDDNDNNSFIANRIIRARYGIATRGNPANLNLNTTVTDNIIGPAAHGADQIGKIGIFLQADDGAIISRNTIQFVGGPFASTSGGADRVGIGIGGENWASAPVTLAGANYTVTRNVIHDVIEERTFSAVGILASTTNGTNPTNNVIANNFVYNVNANGTAGDAAIGIGIGAGNGDRVVFNSVRMAGDQDPSAGATTPSQSPMNLRVANTPTNLTVRNNSLYNDLFSSSAPTLQSANIQLPTATFNFGTGGLNNNNYFFPASNTTARTGAIGTTSIPTTFHQTLANWQAAVTPQDANSIQADPLYVSATDLHLAMGSPNINVGATGTGVVNDIDFQLRDAMPDIGADEFNGAAPPANDIAATAILTPVQGSVIPAGNSTTPQARFYNAGSATQAGVMVQFTITGPGGYNYSNTQAITSIAPDNSVTVTFTTAPVFTTAGMYTMTASVITPDSNSSNDMVAGSFTVVAPITGTVTVGTGGTYPSLTNPGGIFDAMNIATVGGNVTINIISDLPGETGTILLNEFASPFTVTIKPSGAARTISGTSPAAGGLLGFNGADRVTIDGSLAGGTDRSLTIQSGNTASTGAGIYFATGLNGAQNNTIKNANIWGAGATTGTLLGIGFANNTFGAVGTDHDNNRIENNDIRGTFYGIAMLGLSGVNPNVGNVITKNVMPAVGAAGIGRIGMYLFSEDGIQVTENSIASVASATAVDCIGIAAGNQNITLTPATGDVTNAVIARNSIGVVSNTLTNSSVGIVLASGTTGTNAVVNNMVSGVIGNSDATDLVAGILVIPRAGATQNIYHNSVSMTGDRGATANVTPSYALAITADLATNVVNNILFNSQTRSGAGGGGESYAIAFDGPAANANLMSNFNDLFVSGPQGQVGITGDLTTPAQTTTAGTGTNRTTLAAWQAATSEDANSVSVDPLFVSTTNLHLNAGSPMRNAGTAVGVPTDIDGDMRDAMPDIGADELTGPAPGVLRFSSATYSVGEAGPTATITVNRVNGSDGTVTVDYATVAGGTATGGAACTAGIDYVTIAPTTLTFLNGETTKTFNVTICQDTTNEPSETVNLALTNPTGGAVLGTPNTAVLTITDDDESPMNFTVAIADARLTEGNAGSANMTFNVTLTAVAPPLNVGGTVASVQFATANGTATAGSDYTMTSGTLNFTAAGTMTVSVPVAGDTVKEANEFFFVNLSNPSPNTTITDGQGAGIIIDNDRPYVADFDRDLLSDFSVFRPSTSVWYVLQSSNGANNIGSTGPSGMKPVPGDYDGDGKADFAVFHAESGNWIVLRSSDSVLQTTAWGLSTDKPVQGDYDGDGKTDIAIFRPSSGQWWTILSATSTTSVRTFGISTDRLVQGDYDGDFKTDLAVYRDGMWYIARSSDASVQVSNFGLASDKPVSGDFDCDGRFDLAIYRGGQWWVLNSLSGTAAVHQYGLNTDIPAPADFDGDGTTDRAVFRPSTGDWYVLRSSDNTSMGPHWGAIGDIPVPAAYIPQ